MDVHLRTRAVTVDAREHAPRTVEAIHFCGESGIVVDALPGEAARTRVLFTRGVQRAQEITDAAAIPEARLLEIGGDENVEREVIPPMAGVGARPPGLIQ